MSLQFYMLYLSDYLGLQAFLLPFGCISYNVLRVETELLQLSVYFINNLKLARVKMGNFTLVMRNS